MREIYVIMSWVDLPSPEWDVSRWRGQRYLALSPLAWRRWYEFRGQSATVYVFSDNSNLTREIARDVAVDVVFGRRNYQYINLNDDNLEVITERWE